MTKQQKFIAFVQTILAANLVNEKNSITFLNDAFYVTEEELNDKNADSEEICAQDFTHWRMYSLGMEVKAFPSPPVWLSQETVGNILVG